MWVKGNWEFFVLLLQLSYKSEIVNFKSFKNKLNLEKKLKWGRREGSGKGKVKEWSEEGGKHGKVWVPKSKTKDSFKNVWVSGPWICL